MNAVEFDKVSIVFGGAASTALPLMDAGKSREEIQEATGQILGVHDCSLDVAEGEIVVLMGLSGSGKSTLLRAVNGLNPVSRGEVRVATGDAMTSVTHADAKTLRKLRLTRIAMVFQQFGLLPWRTVAENVGLGLELGGVPRAEREAKVREQLALVGQHGRVVQGLAPVVVVGRHEPEQQPAVELAGQGNESVTGREAAPDEIRVQHHVMRRIAGDRHFGGDTQVRPVRGALARGMFNGGNVAVKVADGGVEL